jgi:translation initiation factor 2 alpha subunit (eIF-2alpha)
MRFYKQVNPEEGDIVICKVLSVDDVSVNAQLVEYEHRPGMIVINGISVRKYKSMKKQFRHDKLHAFVIKKISDKYIDLSYRHVDNKEKAAALERFHNFKSINKIVNYVIEKIDTDGEQLLKKTIWTIDKNECWQFVKELKLNNDKINQFDITDEEKEVFVEAVNKFIKDIDHKIVATFNLTCFAPNGVNIIKNILTTSNTGDTCQIASNTNGIYSATIKSKDKDTLSSKICEIYNNISQLSKEHGASFSSKNVIIHNNINSDVDQVTTNKLALGLSTPNPNLEYLNLLLSDD